MSTRIEKYTYEKHENHNRKQMYVLVAVEVFHCASYVETSKKPVIEQNFHLRFTLLHEPRKTFLLRLPQLDSSIQCVVKPIKNDESAWMPWCSSRSTKFDNVGM